ncbi:MAG: MFS transporter [Dehalococcoidia bacterium]
MLALYELIVPWHLQLGAFALGVFYVLDFPAKRTSIHDVSKSNRLSNAMFLDIINHALGKGVGPFLAGFTIQFLGAVGAFSLLLVFASTSFAHFDFLWIQTRKNHDTCIPGR